MIPVGDYIREELKARGWSVADLAHRMGGDAEENELALRLLDAPDRGITLSVETAEGIARAFGTGVEVWLSLDRAWREKEDAEWDATAAPNPFEGGPDAD